jgi:hypothetical protein
MQILFAPHVEAEWEKGKGESDFRTFSPRDGVNIGN